jgi:hypothetical protein
MRNTLDDDEEEESLNDIGDEPDAVGSDEPEENVEDVDDLKAEELKDTQSAANKSTVTFKPKLPPKLNAKSSTDEQQNNTEEAESSVNKDEAESKPAAKVVNNTSKLPDKPATNSNLKAGNKKKA